MCINYFLDPVRNNLGQEYKNILTYQMSYECRIGSRTPEESVLYAPSALAPTPHLINLFAHYDRADAQANSLNANYDIMQT